MEFSSPVSAKGGVDTNDLVAAGVFKFSELVVAGVSTVGID
jgi:hypothetical protein